MSAVGYFATVLYRAAQLCLVAMFFLQACAAPNYLDSNQQQISAGSLSSENSDGQNAGIVPRSRTSLVAWAGLFTKIALQRRAVARNLPGDHVLDAIEAVRQFEAGKTAKLSLTWFGHSSFLIRSGGISILTDPVFSRSVGLGAFRTIRMVPVLPDPMIIQQLDAIIISHGDFDHLDIPTLRRLSVRFPDAVLFVPRNAGRLARRTGFRDIRELGWFEQDNVSGGLVIAVPAAHAVRRPPWPVNSSHWNGYRLNLPGGNLYFSGDTAISSILGEIPRRAGRAEFALVPAGAFAPRELQRRYHATPEEAADIARMVGARLAIGMHWGTFHLSEDLPAEQRRRFLAASTGGIPTTTMKIGETRILRR